jgi:outer membrane protein
MNIRYATTAAAALLLIPAAWAQTGSAAAGAPSKVAILNVQGAIAGTGDGKAAAAELQSQFAPRQTELENLNKQIDDRRTRLRNGQTTLSDDEKARLTREGETAARTLQRKQQEYQDDANEAQREAFDRIARKMIDVIDRYAKENGYAVVIDSSSQSSTVLYAAPQIDITQDIIRLYDEANPVKVGSTAPAIRQPAAQKPAAPKPAPATTKPPQQ